MKVTEEKRIVEGSRGQEKDNKMGSGEGWRNEDGKNKRVRFIARDRSNYR